ncbi:MAG: hypothetical protein WCY62_06355 [Clostridia bacterium]
MKKKASKHRITHEIMYQQDPVSGNIIIDIALDKYIYFFHEWDNTAFRKRDIHPELAAFLDMCSEEIPIRKQFDIHLHVNDVAINKEKEDLILESYYNYYSSLKRLESRKLKKILRSAILLFIVALAFNASYLIFASKLTGNLLIGLFTQGLSIGGWVFMWEALQKVFFESLEPLKRRRELIRFLNADIEFSSDIPIVWQVADNDRRV